MFNLFKHKEDKIEKGEAIPTKATKDYDWNNSAPHLSLLAYLIKPQKVEDSGKFRDYAGVLNESVDTALDRFANLNLVMPATLIQSLARGFTANQLKQILKEHGLGENGSKEVLAARLIENDVQAATKLVENARFLICTDEGKQIAENYLQKEKERRHKALKESEIALREKDFRKATLVMARYEAACVFSRGINISWEKYDTERDENVLKSIFTKTSKLVIKRGWNKIPDVQLIAGMMHLWGNAIEAGIECTDEAYYAARAYELHGIYLFELDEVGVTFFL